MRGPWRYYFDLYMFPIVTMLLAWLDRATWSPTWAALVVTGVLLWTFAEYWTHRVILHKLMWHSTHARHHEHPEEYVVFPFYWMPAIFAPLCLVLPASVFVGFMAGASYFFLWHDALHHHDLSRWPRVAAFERWHNVHHEGFPANYGITHIALVWDWLFGTYRPAS